LQGQANAGAAARGMGPAGDLAPMASDATAVRQAMTGSFAAQQAAQNAAAQTYADSLAHVVGPTQKLAGQAVAQGKVKTARDKLADTKQQRGASALQYQTDTKASESKNVLAGQIAGIGAAAKAVATTETSRHNKAMEGNEAARIRAAAIKAGKLSPSEQKTNAELKFFNKHGYWPPTGAPKPAKPTTTKVPTLSAKDMGDAMTQLAQLKGLAAKAKAGEPFDPKHKKGGRGPLSRSDAAKKILGFATKIRDPLLATAALDVIYRGGSLHPNTVKRLRAAGYDPNRVIQTLGAKGVDAPAAMPKVVTAPSGHGNQKRPT
jgi:hypothetical protein